jgi:type IX secretion system PorP/SprF family membrane protein
MKRINYQLVIGSVLLLCFLFWSSNRSQAQDIHFSQFYASPLTLNPAMTGVMNGCYRGSLMYRSQWSAFMGDVAYETMEASVDAKLLQNKLLGDDFVGAGLRFYTDKSGDAGFAISDIMASGSYHNMLTDAHQLGVGVQLGYVQKNLNYSELVFPQQYGNDGFDKDNPNPGESFQTNNVQYFDMNAGLYWMGTFNEQFSGFGGFSMFHLTRPDESFLGQTAQLPMRYTVHGGTNIRFSNNFSAIPNMIFMYQGDAKELNFGSSIEYGYPNNRNPNGTINIGAWFRHSGNSDAFILVAGLGFKNFKFGASYDITVSSLQPQVPSKNVSALEFSLSYAAPCSQRSQFAEMSCPRF